MLEPQRKTIGDLEFELTPMPAWKSMKVWARLLKFASPVVEAAGRKDDAEGALSRALSGVASNSPEEWEWLTRALLETCLVTVNGQQVALLKVFDVVMQGRLLTVFKLVAWAIQVNYADFWDALKGGLGSLDLKELFKSALQSALSKSGPASASSMRAG